MPPRRARRFCRQSGNSALTSWFVVSRVWFWLLQRSRCRWFARVTRDRLPSWFPLQNTLGILGRRAVAVIVFDHLDGCSHLFCQEINVNAFHQAVGGIGVAETIAAAARAGCAVEQAGFRQKVGDERVVKALCCFPFGSRE